VEEKPGRPICVKTKVGANKLEAMVDMGVDNVYILKELVDEINPPYKKEKGYVKGVNVNSLPIHGVS